MDRPINKEEQEFIKETLLNNTTKHENIDKTIKNNVKNTKTLKQNSDTSVEKKTAFYRNPSLWIGFFILLPILLSGVILLASVRAAAYLGSESLSWLTEQELTDEFTEIAANAGFGWLPNFLQVYDYRWFIIIGLFALCFTIASIIMFADYRKHSKKLEKTDENTIIKENRNDPKNHSKQNNSESKTNASQEKEL